MKRFVAKLRDGVRHDPVLRPLQLAVAVAALVGYFLLLRGGLPDWLVSMLHTLVWLHVLFELLGMLGLVLVVSTMDKMLAKVDGDVRIGLERFAYLPQPLTILLQVYVVFAAYISGYTVAGAILMIAALAEAVMRASMRASIDKFVLNRLSTV